MDKVYMRRYSEAFRQTVVREYEDGESITTPKVISRGTKDEQSTK
jgi:transposase-like protein